MNDLLPGTRIDQRPGEDARLAAEESVGRELLPLRQVGQLAVVGQEAHVPPDPTAAPKRPRSGGVADQLEAFHDDRLIGLLRLDRNVRRIERRRHGLAAVLRRATARARQHQLVGDEASISRAVQAAERRVGEVRRGGGHALGKRRRQRPQHRLERPVTDDRSRTTARRWPRVEERALGRAHGDRPERAFVHRAEGIGETLDGGIRVRARVVDVRVHPRGRLRARPGVIDGHPIAVHRHGDGHAQRIGPGAIVVEEVLEAVHAGRHLTDRGAHARLGARDDLVHGRADDVSTVALDQLDEPQLADAQRASLSPQVAQYLVRRARVGGDDTDDRLVLLVLAPDLGGWDAQSFLEVIEDPDDTLTARTLAADVGVMQDVDGEADQRAVVKGRLRDEEIREVTRPEQRIVEQDRVTGAQALHRVRGQRILHRERHGAHVTGRVRALSHHAPRRIEHRHREVLALARLLGIGRLVNGGADLDGDRLERAPDDAERDGIGRAHGLTLTMRLA